MLTTITVTVEVLDGLFEYCLLVAICEVVGSSFEYQQVEQASEQQDVSWPGGSFSAAEYFHFFVGGASSADIKAPRISADFA